MAVALLVVAMQGMEHVDAKTAEFKLPDNALLDRSDDWADKFDSREDFRKAERAIRAYVNDDHPDNGWNSATKENIIQIYNFDTTAGSPGAGLNVLLMHVQYQASEGTYTPTEAERRLHEWAAERTGSAKAPGNVNP